MVPEKGFEVATRLTNECLKGSRLPWRFYYAQVEGLISRLQYNWNHQVDGRFEASSKKIRAAGSTWHLGLPGHSRPTSEGG